MADQTNDQHKLTPYSLQAWSQLWQLPVLILGLVTFAIGVYLALPEPIHNEFPKILESADRLIHEQEYDLARAELEKIQTNYELATDLQRAKHWRSWADLIFLEQGNQNDDIEENHKTIIKYYQQAEQLGIHLDADRIERLAQTLVSLDMLGPALDQVERLKGEPPQRRYQLVKWIIEYRLVRRNLTVEDLADLLARFLAELRAETSSSQKRSEELWAACLKAEMWLDAGKPQEVRDFLTRKIIRFKAGGGEDDLAMLYLQLARTYQQLGELEDSRIYFLKTQQILNETDVLNARVLVGLGQLEMAESYRVAEALDHFTHAAIGFPSEPSYANALIGMGDCEAKLGMHGPAVEHLRSAITALGEREDPRAGRFQEVIDVVQSHHLLNFDRQEYELALKYITLLKPLFGNVLPPDLVLRFAITHKHIAQKNLQHSVQVKPIDATVVSQAGSPQEVVGALLQKAAIHFSIAADYYLQHANAMSIEDDNAHGLSLWESAEAYERAQLWPKAIEAYTRIVRTRASDQRYLEAVLRLGMAFSAEQQYQAAAEKFVFLVENHAQSQMAFESLVPLAQCYIALEKYDDAKHILITVVEDHPAINPESQTYRDALIELGKLHLQLAEYSDAIGRFDSVVQRYGDTNQGPILIFNLAEAYRQSVRQIDEKLNEVLPQAMEKRHQQTRIMRLQQAQDLYGQVVQRLSLRGSDTYSTAETLYLRNSYFYQADCVYQLEQWDQAIALYDAAAKRWEKYPASLLALIQIVNAYAEQGKIKEATLYNEHARQHLARIPEKAFDDPSLPMNRQHWKDWLYWTSQLQLGPQASVADPL